MVCPNKQAVCPNKYTICPEFRRFEPNGGRPPFLPPPPLTAMLLSVLGGPFTFFEERGQIFLKEDVW